MEWYVIQIADSRGPSTIGPIYCEQPAASAIEGLAVQAGWLGVRVAVFSGGKWHVWRPLYPGETFDSLPVISGMRHKPMRVV